MGVVLSVLPASPLFRIVFFSSTLVASYYIGRTSLKLIEGGYGADARDEYGRTRLMDSCDRGDLESVVLLLSQGAKVNAQDSEGSTPLMAACAAGHEAIVKALLASGANFDQ